jgi:hypothetical protein
MPAIGIAITGGTRIAHGTAPIGAAAIGITITAGLTLGIGNRPGAKRGRRLSGRRSRRLIPALENRRHFLRIKPQRALGQIVWRAAEIDRILA